MEIKETELADKQLLNFLDYLYNNNGYKLYDKYFKFRNSVLCLLDTVVDMVNVVEEENQSEFLDVVDVMKVLKEIHVDCLCIIDDVLFGMRRDILLVFYKPDETSNERLKCIAPKLLHKIVNKVSGNVIFKTPVYGSVYLSLCNSLLHIIDNDMPEQDYSSILINETECETDEQSEKLSTSDNINKDSDTESDCIEYKLLGKNFISKDGTTWHFDIFKINHKQEFVLANTPTNIKILGTANNEGYIRALEYIIKKGYTLDPVRLC